MSLTSSHGFQKKLISPKLSLGSRYKLARKKKQVSLNQAEQETKIRGHYLEAIEDDRIDTIPISHSRGFIRRYGEYLGIEREFIERELNYINAMPMRRHPFSPVSLEKESKWFITPRSLAVLCLIIVLLGFIGYVTYQVRQFVAPPGLRIINPNSEAVVSTETITIHGTTDPGALITIDSIQTTVDSGGQFTNLVALRPGLNQITVKAENQIKKQTTKVVTILYQPTNPTPSPAP